MKRLVFGIVLVFCLQIGFVAYTAIDLPIEGMVAVNEIGSGTNPVANLVNISGGGPSGADKLGVSRPVDRRSARPAATTLASSKKVARLPAARAVDRRQPQFVASREQSQTKPATGYPRVMPFDRQADNYEISARAVPQSKKKSFLSKSFSVIKKPYGWLKSLASKIN